ncbi:MAG: hypothetical protein V4591_03200 [Bdellovibrionota bacterium]
MFDKNVFKKSFRVWSEQFPFASESEIQNFCLQNIPENLKTKYSWLIEESTAWFMWRQEILQKEILQESSTAILC